MFKILAVLYNILCFKKQNPNKNNTIRTTTTLTNKQKENGTNTIFTVVLYAAFSLPNVTVW